jgi:arylsulfatase A-like enzyme
MPFRVLFLSLIAAGSLGCMRASATPEGEPLVTVRNDPPALIVLITVDQLRGDMLDRYRSDLSAGYARLMNGGAWFVNAYQDHAITETAPGHASALSGRFPRSTGITSNSTGVVDPAYHLLVGLPNELGASPMRFQGSTLYDWLVARNRRTRALSVSMKDRGAILTIGRAPEQVYWYSPIGSFTTSNYYRDTLPSWVREFNARGLPYRYAGSAWRLSRDSLTYATADAVPHENRGANYVFPHQIPSDSVGAANAIRATPAMDSITALFALEGLRRTNIGRGPHTDILAVSFSATDLVGHAWGPDSREAHENEIRLDQTLGWFLDSLYRLRDSSTVMIAVTGDHGVQPIPELARERGEARGNQGLRVSLRPQVAAVRSALRDAGVDSMAFFYDGETVAINRAALQRARINGDSVLAAFASAVRQVPGVARVDRISELRRADFAAEPLARRWAHQVPENSPVELVITLTRYSYWGTLPATHGSPYDQDAHVPIIFYGPWAKPGRYTEFARVVDIGPTLAAIARVRPLEKLDGVVLTSALR